MRLTVRAGLCTAMLSFAAQSPPLELVKPAGLDFQHRNSPTAQKYLIETMGGGGALLDYNSDGLLDVFLVNGGRLQDPQKLPVDYCRREPEYLPRVVPAGASVRRISITTGGKMCSSHKVTSSITWSG